MISRLKESLRRHYSSYARRKKFAFLWRAWVETTALAYITSILAQSISHFPARTDLAGLKPFALFITVVVLGPLFETVLFQCLPIELGRSHRMKKTAILLLSVIPFAVAHFTVGVPTVLSAGLVGGFYFAATYLRWRRESLIIAILMTFLLHSSFNFVGFLAMLVFK